MDFCKNCGNELTILKTKSSWESKRRCDKCGLRVYINYGDRQGGGSDSYYFQQEPFENEQIKVAKA